MDRISWLATVHGVAKSQTERDWFWILKSVLQVWFQIKILKNKLKDISKTRVNYF